MLSCDRSSLQSMSNLCKNQLYARTAFVQMMLQLPHKKTWCVHGVVGWLFEHSREQRVGICQNDEWWPIASNCKGPRISRIVSRQTGYPLVVWGWQHVEPPIKKYSSVRMTNLLVLLLFRCSSLMNANPFLSPVTSLTSAMWTCCWQRSNATMVRGRCRCPGGGAA